MTNALPHALIEGALEPEEHRALLDWTLANRTRFVPARVTDDRPMASDGVVKPELRQALVCRDLEGIAPVIAAALERKRAQIFAALGRAEVDDLELELETTAYGDAAHFAAHADIPTGAAAAAHPEFRRRLVSAVYYYHRVPQAFTGGELRLVAPGPLSGEDVSIAPLDGRLAVFPSWLVHQVLPVRCPSRRFEDSRFAVNCWFLEKQA